MNEYLNAIEGFIKMLMMSPLVFLIIIAISIVWQQKNSKKLADESDQVEIQSKVFSWIMSLTIFISVINNMMYVAYAGVFVEVVINLFLVFSDRRKTLSVIKDIEEKIKLIQPLQRKGLEMIELQNKKTGLSNKTDELALSIRIFIAALMPLSLLVLSHLYMAAS